MNARSVPSASGPVVKILAAVLMFASASNAVAQTDAVNAAIPASPSAFVNTLANNAFTILRDPDLTTEERDIAFRSIFLEGFDVPRIARTVLGRHWKRATEAQQVEYQALFENYIIATYSSRLGEFSEYFLRVKAEQVFSKGRAVVSSEIVRPDGGEPFRVAWGIRQNENIYKIVDVKIEGISMTIAQRAEFAAVITNNGNQIEALLEILRERVEDGADGELPEETATLLNPSS